MSSSPTSSLKTHVVPLDYSFMGLAMLSDMLLQDPVSGKKKPSHNDSGNKASSGVGGAQSRTDPAEAGSPTKAKAATATSVSLRVNNNKITSLNDIHDALRGVFDDPTRLQWLDLSGNALSSIGRGTFAPYRDIFTLHLHGNKLHRYSDIDAMAECLPRLHAITLHGNPVEEKKHYRNYVIASFPKLQQLDFSSVTKGDRERAETWARVYKNALASPKRGRGVSTDAGGDHD